MTPIAIGDSGDEGFQAWSYRSHAHYRHEYQKTQESLSVIASTVFADDTVDAWRHKRMYRLLDPLLETLPDATWLTVADGNYGRDAHYVRAKGIAVLATNITDTFLKTANEKGFIDAYQEENAEALSFPDRSFDFALCKEAYHHFPRPMVALYEMLRVARRGIVLIEPNDRYIPEHLPELVLREIIYALARPLFGLNAQRHMYEESGNYVYSISKREVEKVAAGMNYPAVAVQGINDYYQPGVEKEKAEAGNRVFRKVRRIIGLYDLFARSRLVKYRYLAAIIFKEPISPDLSRRLAKSGYSVVSLPANPYAATDSRRPS